jgi:hypothetical protein
MKQPFFKPGGLRFAISYFAVGMTVIIAFKWLKAVLLGLPFR